MKLKTRIFLSFFLIILIPIILGATFFGGTMMFNRQLLITKYGIEITRLGPYNKAMLINLIFSMIAILVITGLVLSLWLYRGIMTPINRLMKATKSIRDGNLDFKLERTDGVTEVEELCDNFEEMRVHLKAANEEKIRIDEENRELISNISHDLKTPITTVRGYCEGLMDGIADTPEKRERYVRTIYNKANEMNNLINELSFYSKITTNRIPYAFNKINARAFFDDAAEEYGDELKEKGGQFIYRNSVRPEVKIIADPEQIQRVMNNIVSNSLKYMDKPQKRITLDVREVNDEVQASIADNGKGIESRSLPLIFNRFYRTDSSRNSSKGGSGIGLSIVKKIIEDHGGRVWAESCEGEGTTMYFALRISDDGKKTEKPENQAAKTGKDRRKRRGTAKPTEESKR